MTAFWSFSDEPSAQQLDAMAAILEAGGVVILPTDTIYGLHARAHDATAVARIAHLKGRDDSQPFIVLAAGSDQFAALGIETTAERLESLDAIWPAPLTVILPLRAPVAASRGASTLAVRVPALPWLRALARRTGPLVSTSVNRSGEPPLVAPADLAHALLHELDGIADAGPLRGESSAILDLASAEPRFIREGEPSFTQNVWKTLWKSL
jgi:L-threonylcarbamoyladenylate synthase